MLLRFFVHQIFPTFFLVRFVFIAPELFIHGTRVERIDIADMIILLLVVAITSIFTFLAILQSPVKVIFHFHHVIIFFVVFIVPSLLLILFFFLFALQALNLPLLFNLTTDILVPSPRAHPGAIARIPWLIVLRTIRLFLGFTEPFLSEIEHDASEYVRKFVGRLDGIHMGREGRSKAFRQSFDKG